ncbi:MAG: metal-binding protein [Aeromicrobium sp.]|nr:metal-binding protein [Aeromicrobium sp.]
MPKTYTLIRPNGRSFESEEKGLLGGWRPGKIYGRLDCPSALKHLARDTGYDRTRVFFADEDAAVGAGYRPCFFCMPDEYAAWKAQPA